VNAEDPTDDAEMAQEALPPTLSALRAEQWLKENKPSLNAYNAFVEKYGVFSDGLRGF
jgi:post-segregation antitoxin (ccd killing protein)